MSEMIYSQLNHVFLLMSQNKLRKDIDDTLLEKLLTFIKQSTVSKNAKTDSQAKICSELPQLDFVEELLSNTKVLDVVKEVIISISQKDDSFFIGIKTFSLRLLGLMIENKPDVYPLDNLMKHSIFFNESRTVINHVSSIQNALIEFLSCAIKELKGALWFVDYNLETFVLQSFCSSSYYVRKSAVNFFISFFKHWTTLLKIGNFETKRLEAHLIRVAAHIANCLCCFQDQNQMLVSECCICIFKDLLDIDNIENVAGLRFEIIYEDLAECIPTLPEDKYFKEKFISLFLSIHDKFIQTDEILNKVVKLFLAQEDIRPAFDLLSAFAKIKWPLSYLSKDTELFGLPVFVLSNRSEFCCDKNYELVHKKVTKLMENKLDSIYLFSSSLSALENLVHHLGSNIQRDLALSLHEVVKITDVPHHKWLFSVLQDRSVHHSLLCLLSSLVCMEVHPSLFYENSDVCFKIILELLTRPSSDINFLSELMLLMKTLLISHQKLNFILNNEDRESLVATLTRMLLDNRETLVDSAIQLTGQVLCDKAWTGIVRKHKLHSIVWDLAIQGSYDGSVRSTALRVIMDGCLQDWCMDEIKTLNGINEIDIIKVLFDFTHDTDFFLQREALTSLFHWMKLKWTTLPTLAEEYFYSALVFAVKSLDLELKLISLNSILWIIEKKNPFTVSTELKDYIDYLVNSGIGLSVCYAIEDYDQPVKYRAADILLHLQSSFRSSGISECDLSEEMTEKPINGQLTVESPELSFAEKNRDQGIDNVMEISTSEQISSICRPPSQSDVYNLKQEYFSVDSEERKCAVSLLWSHIWSKDLGSILQPEKLDNFSKIESILNDIISAEAKYSEFGEETPDCY